MAVTSTGLLGGVDNGYHKFAVHYAGNREGVVNSNQGKYDRG
jgi:hypothetical protein